MKKGKDLTLRKAEKRKKAVLNKLKYFFWILLFVSLSLAAGGLTSFLIVPGGQ